MGGKKSCLKIYSEERLVGEIRRAWAFGGLHEIYLGNRKLDVWWSEGICRKVRRNSFFLFGKMGRHSSKWTDWKRKGLINRFYREIFTFAFDEAPAEPMVLEFVETLNKEWTLDDKRSQGEWNWAGNLTVNPNPDKVLTAERLTDENQLAVCGLIASDFCSQNEG